MSNSYCLQATQLNATLASGIRKGYLCRIFSFGSLDHTLRTWVASKAMTKVVVGCATLVFAAIFRAELSLAEGRSKAYLNDMRIMACVTVSWSRLSEQNFRLDKWSV
ncbi:hypothetical protein, partial [Bradyrhizobium retamae]|uniref:hypothetical protein n=1 Tax=Bradyrhizobium retamae TaxID=1300035 RepID=UPI000AD37FB1